MCIIQGNKERERERCQLIVAFYPLLSGTPVGEFEKACQLLDCFAASSDRKEGSAIAAAPTEHVTGARAQHHFSIFVSC
jgi:hypothetical protein